MVEAIGHAPGAPLRSARAQVRQIAGDLGVERVTVGITQRDGDLRDLLCGGHSCLPGEHVLEAVWKRFDQNTAHREVVRLPVRARAFGHGQFVGNAFVSFPNRHAATCALGDLRTAV